MIESAAALPCRQLPESAILRGMSRNDAQIVPCPPSLTREALTLVLQDIAPEQRAIIAPQLGSRPPSAGAIVDGLWIARRGGRLGGAAWGQRQPGNTAVLWPPQMLVGSDPDTISRLSQAAVASLDTAGVGMTQVLLPDLHAAAIPTLESVGFHYLADLLYLNWETSLPPGQRSKPQQREPPGPLQFEPFAEPQRERLIGLIERTYEGTQDCAAMNGMRPMKDVIDGYQATGVFRPEHWLFVRADQQDVGVLLLTDHPGARHLELMYMGLVPAARGHGWGVLVTRHAQSTTVCAGVERLVLAVDAANDPARAMYRDAGFIAWDRRSVFVRFGKS